jgi:hypothetical protein
MNVSESERSFDLFAAAVTKKDPASL